MRSFDHSFSSSSPILVLPPQLPPQSSFSMDSNRPSFNAPFTNGIHQLPLNSSWSSLTPQSAPPSAAGRKRSRDEAASNLEEDYFPVQAPVALSELENEDEWEYGEGMTLIKPNKRGYAIEASSQTGTWAEEKAAEEKAKAMAPVVVERPILRAAKSQRLDLSAIPAIAEEASSNGARSPGSPERHNEPTVDDFTRHLGIGWSSINNLDADIQAAARGWAKFIENHFPVTDAKIRLQSKGLASYLVETNEGYFLFGEDLKQGRLISTSLEKTWINLGSPVPVFDGEVVMEAGQTPTTENGVHPNTIGFHPMSGVQADSQNEVVEPTTNSNHVIDGTNSEHSLEVEMDMS